MENKLWVARDLSGALFLTNNKPKRCTYEYGMWISKGENMMQVDGFPNLTWKDEPLEVKLQPVITDLDIKTNETTMEKELKIEVPKGYEIDKEKSTFEKIIFKKIPENPKTWEDYCSLMKGETMYYTYCNNITISGFSGAHDKFATKKRAEQFIALGQLMQLRDYWVRGYKEFKYALLVTRNENILVYDWSGFRTYPHILTFPTKEMAEEFKECFSDLIKKAFLL